MISIRLWLPVTANNLPAVQPAHSKELNHQLSPIFWTIGRSKAFRSNHPFCHVWSSLLFYFHDTHPPQFCRTIVWNYFLKQQEWPLNCNVSGMQDLGTIFSWFCDKIKLGKCRYSISCCKNKLPKPYVETGIHKNHKMNFREILELFRNNLYTCNNVLQQYSLACNIPLNSAVETRNHSWIQGNFKTFSGRFQPLVLALIPMGYTGLTTVHVNILLHLFAVSQRLGYCLGERRPLPG